MKYGVLLWHDNLVECCILTGISNKIPQPLYGIDSGGRYRAAAAGRGTTGMGREAAETSNDRNRAEAGIDPPCMCKRHKCLSQVVETMRPS
jgi:hypothetical protein